MKKVIMKYNPYLQLTQISVEGKAAPVNSEIASYCDKRLQRWIEDFPRLLMEEYNDDRFQIDFRGTELDYEDLLAAAESGGKQGIFIGLRKLPAKEYGEKEKAIKSLFGRISRLPFPELQEPDVKNAFELALNELLEVNVVATMSAGKSTLINALLRKKLMPSKQGACTATITRLTDTDDDSFSGKTYDSTGRELQSYSPLDLDIMKHLNDDPQVSKIEASGNIPFVMADEIKLVLIDTPGPDNARDPRHGEITEKALRESSKMLVLFVMNGGKLHDVAQDAFLNKIAKSMSVGGKQSRERFIFVINKMDDYSEDDDDIENETIPDTIKYLEDMGIKEPNVFPAAALPALMIRQLETAEGKKREELLGKLRSKVDKLNNDAQLHLEKYVKLVPGCQAVIDRELKEAVDKKDEIGQALIHTGIRGIEETIRMYVTKYSRPDKIRNVADTFRSKLESADAFEKARKALAEQQSEHEKACAKLNELNDKLKNRRENERFKRKIAELDTQQAQLKKKLNKLSKEVYSELSSFLERCEDEMDEFDADRNINSFAKLADNKQSEYRVTVESVIDEEVRKHSEDLLQQYIDKIKGLGDEFNGKDLKLDLLSFVSGEIATMKRTGEIMDQSIDTRTEVTQEERVRTKTGRYKGADRWKHISRWFSPDYEYEETYTVDVTYEVKYISKEKLLNSLLSPITSKLRENTEAALEYAAGRTAEVKDYFMEQFDKVDRILSKKMEELVRCTSDARRAAAAVKDAERRLTELGKVKEELDTILEI